MQFQCLQPVAVAHCSLKGNARHNFLILPARRSSIFHVLTRSQLAPVKKPFCLTEQEPFCKKSRCISVVCLDVAPFTDCVCSK